MKIQTINRFNIYNSNFGSNKSLDNPNCTYCNSSNTIKNGKQKNGAQKYICKDCGKEYTAPKPDITDEQFIDKIFQSKQTQNNTDIIKHVNFIFKTFANYFTKKITELQTENVTINNELKKLIKENSDIRSELNTIKQENKNLLERLSTSENPAAKEIAAILTQHEDKEAEQKGPYFIRKNEPIINNLFPQLGFATPKRERFLKTMKMFRELPNHKLEITEISTIPDEKKLKAFDIYNHNTNKSIRINSVPNIDNFLREIVNNKDYLFTTSQSYRHCQNRRSAYVFELITNPNK